jgi:hypothetical protein
VINLRSTDIKFSGEPGNEVTAAFDFKNRLLWLYDSVTQKLTVCKNFRDSYFVVFRRISDREMVMFDQEKCYFMRIDGSDVFT